MRGSIGLPLLVVGIAVAVFVSAGVGALCIVVGGILLILGR